MEEVLLGTVRVKKTFGYRNVTEEVQSMVANYIRENMGTYEESVTNDFNLDDKKLAKYTFVDQYNDLGFDKSDSNATFSEVATVVLVYAKSKSLIYMRTGFNVRVSSGCGKMGQVFISSQGNVNLTEVYYSKIQQVSSHSQQYTRTSLGEGCGSKLVQYQDVEEGFIIRGAEELVVNCDQLEKQELSALRKLINERIAGEA